MPLVSSFDEYLASKFGSVKAIRKTPKAKAVYSNSSILIRSPKASTSAHSSRASTPGESKDREFA